MKKVIYCSVCKKPLSGRQTLFCSTRCKNHVHQSYGAQKERALERKLYFIKSMGGECVRCGYNENLAALSFHHRGGKEYELDARSLSNRGFGDMSEEISKCDLLCANCHMELHHPHLNVAKLSTEPTALTTELQARMPRERSAQRDAALIIAENAPFEKKFSRNLAQCGIKPGQTIVLGVSGGVDSIVMLDLFAKYRSDISTRLNLVVAHVNHNARPDSASDELFVKELALKHGSKYYSHILKNIRVDGNKEEYFRNERRKFLLEVAEINKANFVALAHNANDQAETFIMHAVRGSGPAGLGGMDMSEDGIIRPLLNFSRTEIEACATQNKLTWHEDATNKDVSYDRNYIRHRVLPLLTRLNPEYLKAIGRNTHLQRQIDEHLKEEALYVIRNDTVIPALNTSSAQAPAGIQRERGLDSSSRAGMTNEKSVSAEHLRRLDKPLLYEVLGLLYEEAKGDRQNLSLAHLSNIAELISTSNGTKTLDLPGEITVSRRYDKLDFSRKSAHNTPSTPSTKKLPARAVTSCRPGKIGSQVFSDWIISISPVIPALSTSSAQAPAGIQRQNAEGLDSRLRGNDERGTRNDNLIIDASTLPNLVIRTRKPGDRIASIGLASRKRLQDLFVDAKIDRVKRDTWPIVENKTNGEILWIPGLAKAKVPLVSKKLLTINIVEVTRETIEEK